MKMPYNNHVSCMVDGCNNDSKNSDVRIFHPPTDPELAQKWLTSLRYKAKSRKKLVCSDHFELKCFSSILKNRLLKQSVPTLQEKCSQKVIGPTLEECKEADLIKSSLNRCGPQSSKKSEDSQKIISDKCVVARLYVMSNDNNAKNKLQNKTKAARKREIEETLEAYLAKRYSSSYHQSSKKLVCSSDSEISQVVMNIKKESSKENCSTLGQMTNSQAVSTNNIPLCLTSKNHYNSYLHDNNPLDSFPNSSHCQQYGILNNHLSQQPVNGPNARSYQNINYPLNRTQSCLATTFKQSELGYINSSQVDDCDVNSPQGDDCDIFAQSIAAQLKNLKKPLVRAKAKLNIQRILFEAETGVYDK